MLATRRQNPQSLYIPQEHHWNPSSTSVNKIATTQPQYIANLSNNVFSFGIDQPLFDFQPTQLNSSPSRLPMQTDQQNTWFSHGQLTPTSTTRAHHRESSLSSFGSAGPSSPYTSNTSNPAVAGDSYNDFGDYQHHSSKPLTPIHTPLQETFLTPQYGNYYQNSNLGYSMAHDGISKQMNNAQLMPAPELINNSVRRAMAVANDSSSPHSSDENKNGETSSSIDFWSDNYSHLSDPQASNYKPNIPKLERTMTDIYADELYNPQFQFSSAPQSTPMRTAPASPQNDVFTQRLQAANNQHLSANTQTPLMVPSRERSPFRQGSPLAPSNNGFGLQSNSGRFGTASHIREQQKAVNDARAIQQHIARTSPMESPPKTISPKDVDLVYHESEEDSKAPLFPPQERQSPVFRQQPRISHESGENAIDDAPSMSQQSFGSMATSRRESSSNYSSTSQNRNSAYNFATPAVPNRQIPQHYPFVPQSHRQTSNMSNEDFPATLNSMESSGSDYVPDSPELLKKPAGASADTGTYTCTYHGCTLRFDTPAKLQRHKREGHRSATVMTSGAEEGGMTSAAQRNSQAGPHKVSSYFYPRDMFGNIY
jgi:26S proteasome regulatory subunit N4